jgi:hypothetical protein
MSLLRRRKKRRQRGAQRACRGISRRWVSGIEAREREGEEMERREEENGASAVPRPPDLGRTRH